MPEPIYATTSNTPSTTLFSDSILSNSVSGANSNITSSNTNDNIALVPKGSGVIDVCSDFVWSITPKKNVLRSIPYVYLVERSQETNSLISSALYYITTFLNTPNTTLTSGNNNNIITYIIKLLQSSLGRAASTNFNDTIKQLKTKLDNLINNQQDKALLSTDTLKSYIGIYLTKKTGFKYVLPYFGDSGFSLTNSWASESQTSPLIAKRLVSQVMDAVDTGAATLNILQPGTFIEKPKYFQYPSEGDSITVTFPLLNTHNPYSNILPYQQNYELLWILAYQNKPYRTSFSRILPPKIYTLTIPGAKYMPYCYISNMSVDFQGTRRNLEVTLPTGRSIIAPIPEAYTVSITFTGLLADLANMMASDDFGFKINTSFR